MSLVSEDTIGNLALQPKSRKKYTTHQQYIFIRQHSGLSKSPIIRLLNCSVSYEALNIIMTEMKVQIMSDTSLREMKKHSKEFVSFKKQHQIGHTVP